MTIPEYMCRFSECLGHIRTAVQFLKALQNKLDKLEQLLQATQD